MAIFEPVKGVTHDADADHDPVNKPKHYTSSSAKCSDCGASIECIQVTETMSFTMGNALKYIWRADMKNGIEDLEKSRWYLDREIARRKAQA